MSERLSSVDLENANKILKLLHEQSDPAGVTQDKFMALCKSQKVSEVNLERALNLLLSKGRLRIFEEGDVLYYKPISSEDATKFRGLGAEDRLIFSLIEAEGNNGIWIRYIKTRSRLPQSTITKALRTLMDRRLIKEVKSIKNHKVYMLFDVEPSHEVIGNVFMGPGREMDSEFVAIMCRQCFYFIKDNPYTTLAAIADFIQTGGWCTVSLRTEDVELVVNALIFDGKVEKSRPPQSSEYSGTITYKANKLTTSPVVAGLLDVPCCSCPVFEKCSPGGEISPEKCGYLTDWLSQDW